MHLNNAHASTGLQSTHPQSYPVSGPNFKPNPNPYSNLNPKPNTNTF